MWGCKFRNISWNCEKQNPGMFTDVLSMLSIWNLVALFVLDSSDLKFPFFFEAVLRNISFVDSPTDAGCVQAAGGPPAREITQTSSATGRWRNFRESFEQIFLWTVGPEPSSKWGHGAPINGPYKWVITISGVVWNSLSSSVSQLDLGFYFCEVCCRVKALSRSDLCHQLPAWHGPSGGASWFETWKVDRFDQRRLTLQGPGFSEALQHQSP